MRRWAIGLGALALVATGCTTPTPPEGTATPDPEPSVSAIPSEEAQSPAATPQAIWQLALDTTRATGASTIEAQFITNVEGFERIVSGVGYAEIDRGFGDIEWTDELGASREVLTESGHFLELDGAWFEIEGDGSLPTTTAFDPLAGLDTATNIVDAGSEDVAGTETTRLDADLDPIVGVATMGFSQEEQTVFTPQANTSLIATIWVDPEGRIVRILREYTSSSIDGDPITATSLFLLADLGQYRPIDVPETQDAIPAPL